MELLQEEKELIVNQLKDDSLFLQKQNVLAYRLLIGIHNISEQEKKMKEDKRNEGRILRLMNLLIGTQRNYNNPIYQMICGGLKNAKDDEIAFMGIIDILTSYDLKKVSENVVKTFWYRNQPTEISAVPPAEYQERFFKFLSSKFV